MKGYWSAKATAASQVSGDSAISIRVSTPAARALSMTAARSVSNLESATCRCVSMNAAMRPLGLSREKRRSPLDGLSGRQVDARRVVEEFDGPALHIVGLAQLHPNGLRR